MFKVGAGLNKSLAEVGELPFEEVQLWKAYFLRDSGVPIGNDEGMQLFRLNAEKARKQQAKAKHKAIVDSIRWQN